MYIDAYRNRVYNKVPREMEILIFVVVVVVFCFFGFFFFFFLFLLFLYFNQRGLFWACWNYKTGSLKTKIMASALCRKVLIKLTQA